MFRRALIISLLAISAGSAVAADMPARYNKAPIYVDPGYNWTGFYIGANAGYSWGRSKSDASYYNTLTGAPIVAPAGSILGNSFNMDGAIAGGQIGYNWQVNNSWVWGLEADAQWSGERGSTAFRCANTLIGGTCLPNLTFLPPGVTGTNLSMDQSLEWFGTVRGRAGWLAAPKVLLYATGGLAYGEIKSTGTLAGASPAGLLIAATGSSTTTRFGWTAGAGIEGVIAPRWTAKLEYLYMDLGSYNALALSLAPASPIGVNVRSSFTDHILRAGINYQFNSPVVAKY
jgi:outer membrane immunogenic protein